MWQLHSVLCEPTEPESGWQGRHCLVPIHLQWRLLSKQEACAGLLGPSQA